MEIKVIKKGEVVTKAELEKMAEGMMDNLVKAVVDVEQGIMAVGGEFHSDEETKLMEEVGSKREHTWGINIYSAKSKEEWVEFDSMVNLKPAFGNRTRGVENAEIQEKIKEIVNNLMQ